MKNIFKILLVLICLYVFSAKMYATISDIINYKFDIVVNFADLITIGSTLILPWLFGQKTNNIKYKIIWSLLLIVSVLIQIFVGLFSYLSKDPRIDQVKTFWTFDIPNLLSLFIMIFLIIIILKK